MADAWISSAGRRRCRTCGRENRRQSYLRRVGALQPPRFTSDLCEIHGCDKRRQDHRPYCAMHHFRIKRHGSPHTVLRQRRLETPIAAPAGSQAV